MTHVNLTLQSIIQILLLAAHLFGVSGSGKTRLALEGLCHNWGFYISCQSNPMLRASGSRDFEAATTISTSMSTWNQGMSAVDISNNETAADRVFYVLVSSSFCVLFFMNYTYRFLSRLWIFCWNRNWSVNEGG
jgi:hypothetical protein